MNNKDFQAFVSEEQQSNNDLNYQELNVQQNQPSLINILPQLNDTQSGISTQADIVFRNEPQTLYDCEESRIPILIICPFCKLKGQTIIVHEMGFESWCCIMTSLLLCCLVCTGNLRDENCQNVKHYCRHCKKNIAVCQYQFCKSSELID